MRETRHKRGGVRPRASIAPPLRFEFLEARELLTGNPSISALSPVDQSINMPLGTNLVATFNVPINPRSISSADVLLKDAKGLRVPAALSYSSASNSINLVPSVALQPLETFTATIKSGSSGVLGADGSMLSADISWSFTTEDFTAATPNATPGVKIDRTTGLLTNTVGGEATFAMVLTTQPTGDVTIPLQSSNVAAGTVSPSQIVFTPSNWNMPQAALISGTVGPQKANNLPYQILVGTISSQDLSYNGINPSDVSVVNQSFANRTTLEGLTYSETSRFNYSALFAVAQPAPMMQTDMTPAMLQQQNEALALVSSSAFTNRAIQSGNWSDPLTWSNLHVPAAGANVWVMPGRTVTVDGDITPSLHTIRVSGTLNFSTTANSSVKVDTLEVDPLGSLVMGTVANPIPAGVTANVTFTDNGPINRVWDPYGLSRGLIAQGSVSIVGAAKTGSVSLAAVPQVGAYSIVVGQTPVGWRVGDLIDIPGTSGGADEQFAITAISSDGRTITLNAPIALSRTASQPGQSLLASDLTRNINFGSQNTTDDARKGHVMLMHNNNVLVEYAAFNSLGRTDCALPINNPVVDKNGFLVPGTGTNPKDRWSFQIDEAGTDNPSTPILVAGNVVTNSPDWGFVNHSSNVDFEDNVVYDSEMGSFVTEVGNEMGTFNKNVAIKGDMNGFWLNGPYVTFTNNTATGFSATYSAGVKVWAYSNADANGVPIYFDSSKVGTQGLMPAIDPLVPAGQMRIELLPFHLVNTTVYNSWEGIEVRGHQGDLGDAYRSTIDGGSIWGVQRGLTFNYSTAVTVNNLAIYGNGQFDSSGIFGDLGPRDLVFNNLTVVDWGTGITFPASSNLVVQGGFYNNTVNFRISTFNPGTSPGRFNRTIAINGVTYGTTLLPSLLIPSPNNIHYNLYLDPTGLDPSQAILQFLPSQITYNGRSVFFLNQGANFVVTGTGNAGYDGLTNAQLSQKYGVCMQGVIAPADATTDPLIFGGTIE